MATNPSPDPKSSLWNLIAFYLRLQRTQRGLSGEALGHLMKASKATVSRIENGVERLDGTRAALIDKGWNTGGLYSLLVWYASIGHDPEWFGQYTEFEQRSRMIRMFDPLAISGLFQTEDYARALFEAGGMSDVEHAVAMRMSRKGVLDRAFITAILSENAIRWPVGSPKVMVAQLDHLITLAERPNIVIHVVPQTFETGAYPGMDGPIRLINGDGFGDLAYAEAQGAGRLVSSPEDVNGYAVSYARIAAKALPDNLSQKLIMKVSEGYR